MISEKVSRQQIWLEQGNHVVTGGKLYFGKQPQDFIFRIDGNVKNDIIETRLFFSPRGLPAMGPGQKKNRGGQ